MLEIINGRNMKFSRKMSNRNKYIAAKFGVCSIFFFIGY